MGEIIIDTGGMVILSASQDGSGSSRSIKLNGTGQSFSLSGKVPAGVDGQNVRVQGKIVGWKEGVGSIEVQTLTAGK